MIITFEDKKNDFLENSINAFTKLDLNDARQSAESFCKLIILKEFEINEANKIINDEHQVIKKFDLETAINSILFKNKLRNNNPLINKKIKSYLMVLQNHGNLDSHDDDFSKIDMNEIEFGLYNLLKIIKFFYIEYLQEKIPNKLDILTNTYEEKIKNNIEKNNTDWKKLNDLTNNFSSQLQRFVLITDKCNNNPSLSNLANISWSYIGDFDKESYATGLLNNIESELIQYRDLNLITIDDNLEYTKSTTYFEFLNGYSEIESSIVDGYRKWQKKYIISGKIEKHLYELYNGGISTSDIYILLFWEDQQTLKYLLDYLNVVDDIFLDATHLVFLSTNNTIRSTIKKEINEYENIKKHSVFNLSLENFSILLKDREKINSNDIILPALVEGNEASIKLNSSEYLRYIDDLKIFPYNYDNDQLDCSDYYKGQPINFIDLNNECDVYRHIGKTIEIEVNKFLKNRNSQLIYLISEPSAGTTTISNRILWNFKDDYPCFELVNYRKQITYEFLQKVYTQTSKPILIFADHKIHEENIKNLTSELNSKNISHVILYVNRFLDNLEALKYKKELEKTPARLPFIISEKLVKKENESFYRKFANKYPSKQESLLNLRNSRTEHSPFKYSFTVFLDEYNNLDTYIEERLKKLTGFQLNRIKYLALIQYYTGLDVTIKFLTKKINKYSLFEENCPINSLITYEDFNDELKIEFIHNIICEKLLENISNVSNKKAWKQKLAEIGLDFLDFIEKEHNYNKDNNIIKDIINRLFIKRNITNYDSENRNSIKYYTDFIDDLKMTSSETDARERIFKKLVDLYPNDKHFLAHLGRFYSVDRKNLNKSLSCMNKAIELSKEEGQEDSMLSHMKGMSYLRALNNEIRTQSNIDDVIRLGELAAECFKDSRENDTQVNNHYPFVSHAQMLLNILRYGKKTTNDLYKFIEEYKDNEFISNIIDDIENLISDFEVIRSKSDDYTDMKKIKNELWELQGDIGKSLEMLNNLLNKNTHYNPVIRRSIVRLNIQKHKENINDIPEKQINTLISHLSKNLDNFSLEECNSTDLLLWLRLIRHKSINFDILDITDILSNIRTQLEEEIILNKVQKNIQIIVLYYLHIIKFIQYKNGDNDVFTDFMSIKNELKNKAMYLDGKTIAREWLYSGDDYNLKKVINWYDKKLTWVKEEKFFNLNSEQHLEVCKGVIRDIQSQKNGVILYKNTEIHFIPRNDFNASDINKEVIFYLSFSYDQMSAWKVMKT